LQFATEEENMEAEKEKKRNIWQRYQVYKLWGMEKPLSYWNPTPFLTLKEDMNKGIQSLYAIKNLFLLIIKHFLFW
jgi:hypothetical protein